MAYNTISMTQQYRQFIYSIYTFHIQCRIAFSKTELLGLQQGFIVIQPILKHFG